MTLAARHPSVVGSAACVVSWLVVSIEYSSIFALRRPKHDFYTVKADRRMSSSDAMESGFMRQDENLFSVFNEPQSAHLWSPKPQSWLGRKQMNE